MRPELEMLLTVLEWRRDEHGFRSPDDQLNVAIADDGYELSKFDDSDVDGVAAGRYVAKDSGEAPAELLGALKRWRGLPDDVDFRLLSYWTALDDRNFVVIARSTTGKCLVNLIGRNEDGSLISSQEADTLAVAMLVALARAARIRSERVSRI